MISSSSFRLLALCALAITMSPILARAADGDRVVSPPVSLVGNSGKVAVGEIEVKVESNGQLFPSLVAYFLDVLDPSTEVAAFAVSGDFFDSSSGRASLSSVTNFPGWHDIELVPRDWDNGVEFLIGGTIPVTTSSLGTAASLFGHDPYISLYYLSEGANVIYDDGSSANDQDADDWGIEEPIDLGQLRFWADVRSRSEFIALDINGQVLDFSVPEPGTLAMGAILILGMTKRRARMF